MLDEIKMWECVKYGTRMMESKSAEFCATRFEKARDEPNTAGMEKCLTCERGAIMSELGHSTAKPIGIKRGGYRAMGRKFKDRECDVCHKMFTPTGPKGSTCPKCKELGLTPPPPAPPKPGSLVGLGSSLTTITIDLTLYPLLHKRLLEDGLHDLFSKIEEKAQEAA